MDEYDTHLINFSELWLDNIQETIPPKIDTLLMNSGANMRALDGWTGALSEQAIERIHNVTNIEARAAFNIANAADRTNYIHQVPTSYYLQSIYLYLDLEGTY